jgi:tetratricopeptide (TPR) repeat protein
MGPVVDRASLLEELREDLGFRRIRQGISRLEQIRPLIETMEPVVGAGVFAGLVAQWIDAGFDRPQLLRRILARFPAGARPSLPLLDYLHLRMAEGVVAMSEEDYDRAARHFLLVQSFEEEIPDRELLAIANFWIGRCHRKAGQYDEAVRYTERGENLAMAQGYTQMAAIMRATLSWLAFQKGKLDEAVESLRRADDALSRTDDFLNRGNIQSAYGRIARRQGKYERAVEYFEQAIAEYRIAGGGQTQLARALLNLAFVRRLLALDAHKELDRLATSRRGSRECVADRPDLARERRLRIDKIRARSRDHLEEAMKIYERFQNHRGIAGVHINRGFLYLDAGDLERAALEAAAAFAYGSEKSDYIVMARARTLQCIVENAAIEEQVEDTAIHHEAAETFARDALTLAGHTQNRRLLARAHVWQGLTWAAAPSRDLDRARRSCEEAIALLQPDASQRQYVWDDLETLKARVLETVPVDPLLRAWSAGAVEDKSFQQMTEEFARIVIPKVWEREGRKVSRVAEKLSISPKKVRRILQAAGVSDKQAVPGEQGTK